MKLRQPPHALAAPGVPPGPAGLLLVAGASATALLTRFIQARLLAG